jgi:hypothetical protein
MSFTNWCKRREIERKYSTVADRRAAVAALKINFMQPGHDDEGYYRKPITEAALGADGKTNGKKNIIGWVPVAYYLSDPTSADGVELCGVIGSGASLRNMTPEEVADAELWSWVVGNSIDYEIYKLVAEDGGEWPDLKQPETAPERRVSDNAGPIVKTREDHEAAIKAVVLSAPKTIASKEDAEHALGIKNVIAEKRLAADKAGRAVYEPPFRIYQAEQKAWTPMVHLAKTTEDGIDKLYRGWLETERRRIVAENAEIARKAQEEEDRNARAADRAIIAGEDPPPPEVVEDEYKPVISEPVKPSYGGARAAKAELKTFVDIVDEGRVAAYFRGDAELVAVLQKLAERATKAGTEVPGTTTRQGFA